MHGGRELVFQEPELVDDQLNREMNGRAGPASEPAPHRVTHWTGDEDAQTKDFAPQNAPENQPVAESRASGGNKARR
jgi:hypothetical protein